MWERDIGGWTLACFRVWTGKNATVSGKWSETDKTTNIEDYPVILYATRLWKSIIEMCAVSLNLGDRIDKRDDPRRKWIMAQAHENYS